MLRVLLGVIAALALACAVLWLKLDAALDREAAEREAKLAVALAHAENARRIETGWQQKVTEAQHGREADRARHARIERALRADRDRLRDDVAAYAAGPADDSVAACRGRAETLGALLGDAVRTAAAAVEGAEQCSADLRAVLAGWPRRAGAVKP